MTADETPSASAPCSHSFWNGARVIGFPEPYPFGKRQYRSMNMIARHARHFSVEDIHGPGDSSGNRFRLLPETANHSAASTSSEMSSG